MDITNLKKYNNLIEYRDAIMEQLTASTDLATLCKNKTITEEETMDLIWENYIPMLFVDGTIKETEAYIMFDIDVRGNKVSTYNNARIYFQIYCDKSIVRANNGQCTRIDAIASELMRLFDGKTTLGGYNVRIADSILNTTNVKYIGRQIEFEVTDFAERSKIRAKKY